MGSETTRKTVDVIDEMGEQYLRALCRDQGVSVERVGVRTPEPMLILAVIGVAATVSLIVERWDDRLRGGQVIDLRPDAERVAYRDPELAYGYVIVRAVDGTVTVHVHELPSQTLEIVRTVVDALSGMTGKSVREIAETAKASVGSQASVEAGDT
jgi:hypothetical protein